MKHLSFIILAAIIASGCMNREERRITDFLNYKLKDSAPKITNVEIIGEDSVLTLADGMQTLYNECMMYPEGKDSAFIKLNEYYYQASVARACSKANMEKDTSFIKPHPYDWRRIVKVKAKGEDGTVLNNID